MNAQLRILTGSMSGQVLPISGDTFLIGREEDCHLRPTSEFISRRHCLFSWDNYTLRIRDLGSKNGAHVNGRRIGNGDEMVLLHDDVIAVGDLMLLIHLDHRLLPGTHEHASSPAVQPPRPIDPDTTQEMLG